MRITIVCVGKVKEAFYRDAISEFAKRLSKYCKFEIVEVADEKTPDGASSVQENQIKEKEAERILAKLKEDAYVCTLEIAGRRLSSEQFADWIEKSAIAGKSHFVFVIGGSLGLHEKVLKRSDFALSFSDMTFPHQLMRVILCEQIYRAYRIINGEPYHK
ncbi:MAG: 23S rRNA (pseudouridine(1915)-N(3))-methyltransferase RlmH [Lachnospiraceae bacterium]|nr:23S rRNA (pseudouridine(1915)-N(3))-methyltransferase RlmH [Lachnospiraceae bacterium]